MKVVWKFEFDLRLSSVKKIDIPYNAKVVAFKCLPNRDDPSVAGDTVMTFWVELDTSEVNVKREFQIFGTGDNAIPDRAHHCGTGFMGTYVWHLYEVTP